MKLSDFVMRFVFDRNVRHVFGYPGGSMTHLLDSLHKIEGFSYGSELPRTSVGLQR